MGFWSLVGKTLKWGGAAVALSFGGLVAYRVFTYNTGFCPATMSFNDPDTIRRLAIEKMLPHMSTIRDGSILSRPYKTYDDMLEGKPNCCRFAPHIGEGYRLYPNELEHLFGKHYVMAINGDFETKEGFGIGVLFETRVGHSVGGHALVNNCGAYTYFAWRISNSMFGI